MKENSKAINIQDLPEAKSRVEEFLDYLPSIGVLPQYYVKIEPLVHVIPLPPTWMKETSSSMPKSTRILDL